MADSPFTSKASEKRTSLAEMAARAAQRTSRPPPAPSTPPSSRNPASMAPRVGAGSYAPPPATPSYAPPPSFRAPPGTDANGSGLINLNHISQAPTLSPAVRAIDPRTVTPTTPFATAVPRSGGGGSRMVLAGIVVALVGIGVAYGLTSQNGSDAPTERAAALGETPAAVQANALGVAPPGQPKAEAPAPVAAAEKAIVNTPPGAIAPAEATEITRAPAAAAHATPKAGKGRKPAAARKCCSCNCRCHGSVARCSCHRGRDGSRSSRGRPCPGGSRAPRACGRTGRARGTRAHGLGWSHQKSGGTHGADIGARKSRTAPSPRARVTSPSCPRRAPSRVHSPRRARPRAIVSSGKKPRRAPPSCLPRAAACRACRSPALRRARRPKHASKRPCRRRSSAPSSTRRSASRRRSARPSARSP